jgi:CRP/FNR family cyclic AMP-dependent transcriptional regulator
MLTARRQQKQRLEVLQGMSLFEGCTRGELARIERLGTPIAMPAGRTLIRQGTDARQCFVVRDGVAVAERDGELLGAIEAGSVAGEMALLDHSARSATVVADTPMHVIVLDRREFASLFDIAPHLRTTFGRIATERRNPSTIA